MSDTAGTGSSGEEDGVDKSGESQQKKKQDNDENNDDILKGLWEDPSEDTNKKRQVDVDPQQKPADDPNKTFNTYIEGLNLTDGIELATISADLNQGNTDSLNKAFGQVAQTVYRQTMIDVNRVMDKKIEQGITKAVEQSGNAVQGNMAVDKMRGTLGFTKDPTISPIASAVLAQLIKKGKSVDEAIVGVEAFFRTTANISAKELNRRNPPQSRPGGKTFQTNNIPEVDDADDVDWMEMLNV